MEPLHRDLFFLGTTAAAQQILAETYEPPPDVNFSSIGERHVNEHYRQSLACTADTLRQQSMHSERLSEIHALLTKCQLSEAPLWPDPPHGSGYKFLQRPDVC